ncbi:MAG: HPr(Ser) kinase/phosphatase [Mariprofundaceae bacterium]
MSQQPRIRIDELLKERSEALQMRLLEGEAGLYRLIDHPRVEKPSLAFAGFLEDLNDYRLQVVGKSELGYLTTRPEAEQKRAVDALFDLRLAAVVVTYGIPPPQIIRDAARRTDTPLISTQLPSQNFMTDVMLYLSRRLAPRTHQHGVYMDIFGLGVLLIGASGIGKSEIGLELISRGHRLIADDMVELVREGPDILVGRSPESLRFHMEIRGLGILNIRDLYGAAAITDTKRLRLVVEMIPWERIAEEDRILGEEGTTVLHEVEIPKVLVPIRSGRSLAVLVEVATRNQLLKQRGIDSGKAFAQSLEDRIKQGGE